MKKKVENYTLDEVVGSGEYGKVYKSVNFLNNQICAIKVVKKTLFDENPKFKEFIKNEITILKKIENPHIVKFYDILSTQNNVYFVYEFCEGGTLDKLLDHRKYLTEPEAMELFFQMVKGFKTVVELNIIHRDFKPQNILFKNGKLKIGDFGFCTQLSTRSALAKTMLGSPLYMAPEVFNGWSYCQKADIWSLGVVLYEMLYGICPFEASNINQLHNLLNTKELTFNEKIKVSEKTKELLRKMLRKSPGERIEWKELFDVVLVEGKEINREIENDFICKKILNGSSRDVCFNNKESFLKYCVMARFKICFLVKIIKNLLKSNVDLAFCFLFYKFVLNCAAIFERQFTSFKELEFRYETLKNDCFFCYEFKKFFETFLQEIQLIRKNCKEFFEIMPKYLKEGKILIEKEFEKEKNLEIPMNYTYFFQKIINQCEILIKNDKKFLLINSILDSLTISELFENFLDMGLDLESQDYFRNIENMDNIMLEKIVNKKIDFLKKNFEILPNKFSY